MSVETAAAAQAAEDALLAARRARAVGDLEGAGAYALECIRRAGQCLGLGDDRRPDDANDVQRALTAASQAQDFVQPAQRAWREPRGWRRPGSSAGASRSDVTAARSQLDGVLDRLARMGAGR